MPSSGHAPTRRIHGGARLRRLGFVALLLLLAARGTFASTDTVRVKTGPAPIYERPRAGSEVMATVPVGTLLEVLKKEDGWYWVVLPPDAYGTRRAGYIQASVVELVVAGGAEKEEAAAAKPAPEPAAASKAANGGRSVPGRFLVRINAGYQLTTSQFTDEMTRSVYNEDATFLSTYLVPRGVLVDAGFGVVLWKNLSIGVGISSLTLGNTVDIAGSVPHPLFFGKPRQIEGQATGLTRGELGIHVEAGLRIPLAQRFGLTIAGGPSLLRVQQDLVSTVQFSEAYPYDAAVFDSVQRSPSSGSAVGFNVGADFTGPLWRFIGFGAGARFTRAEVSLVSPDGHAVKVRAGGIQALGGLRIRF